MPSFGFAIVAGYYLHKAASGDIIKSKVVQLSALIIFIFIVFGFSYKTVIRNKVWKDDYTLFTTDVKTSVNSAKVNVSAGGTLIDKAVRPGISDYQREQRLTQAVGYIENGLALHPKYTAGWLLLGNGRFHLGDYSSSMEAYLACLEISPGHEYAVTNLSMLGKKALRENELEIARKSFEQLIDIKPQNAAYYYQLALVYEKKGDFDNAVKYLEITTNKDSDYYRAYRKRGEIEGKIFGELDSSIKYLSMAFNIAPNDPTTLENLGVAHGIAGQMEKSLEYLYLALEQSPDNVQVLGNIALTYRRMGNTEKAQVYLERSRAVNKK